MAKKIIVDQILKVFSQLGGNISDVLGTRTNISFLGKGDNVEPFLDKNLNAEALGILSQSKAIDEAKNAVGFAVSDKLNDIQANNLLTNLNKMKEFYMPPAGPANITDLATGTRNLDAEGLGALRAKVDDVDLPPTVQTQDPNFIPIRADQYRDVFGKSPGLKNVDLPPPGSRGGPEDIAAPLQDAETTIANLEKQDPELAAQFKAVMLNNKGDVPNKRASSREFLVEALKKENPNQTTFADVISETDVKYITEGGGGIAGDPIVLVEKYFGPRIAEMIPSGATSEEIVIFTNRVLNEVVDANGLRPTDFRFDRSTARFIDEVQDFAKGGLAKILEI